MVVAGNDPLIRTVPVTSVRAPPGRPPYPMAAVGEPFARQSRGERLPRSAYALPCDQQRGVAARRGRPRRDRRSDTTPSAPCWVSRPNVTAGRPVLGIARPGRG